MKEQVDSPYTDFYPDRSLLPEARALFAEQ
jgi:hypothetical protein